MTISRVCFCVPDSLGPFTLRVEKDTIVSVSPDNGFTDNLPTVEGLFDLIQEAISSRVAELIVEYDPTLGYPTRVKIDRDFRIADEEIEYKTSVSNVVKKSNLPFNVPTVPERDFRRFSHQANVRRWRITSRRNYRYKFTRLCFCHAKFRGPFIITVKNRAVFSAEYEDNSLGPVSQEILDGLPTISKLFQLIAKEAEDADEVTVTYDPFYGYPRKASIDRIAQAIDDEITYLAELINFE
eukprot:g6939.t1